MKINGIVLPVIILTMGLIFIADIACASTRGFEGGTSVGGLEILLLLFAAIVIFCVAYLLWDRMKQLKVNRMKESGDIDGLIGALRSPWLGRKSARALGETGDERAVEPLIMAMGDKREDIRKSAAEALGKVGDARAVEPLSRALNDSYDSVRVSARSALDNVRKRNKLDAGPV